MNAQERETFFYEVGECVQNIIYLNETGRHKASRSLWPQFDSLRETADAERVEILFFKKQSRIRKPHSDFLPKIEEAKEPQGPMPLSPNAVLPVTPYLPPAKFSRIAPIGRWTVPNDREVRYRVHILMELVIDGSGGKVIAYPGDIDIHDIPREEENGLPRGDSYGEEFSDREFLRGSITYPFDLFEKRDEGDGQ